MSQSGSTFESAILSTLVKQLEMAKESKAKQDKMIEYLNQIIENQQQAQNDLIKLLTKPKPEELGQIKQGVGDIIKITEALDLENVIKTIERAIDVSTNHADAERRQATKEISEEIKQSNSAANLATLKQLVEGLRKMHTNTMTVANRMEVLASNVHDEQVATNDLASTIKDSNARVISMDMRMGSLITDDSGANLSADDALKMLSQLSATEPADTSNITQEELPSFDFDTTTPVSSETSTEPKPAEPTPEPTEETTPVDVDNALQELLAQTENDGDLSMEQIRNIIDSHVTEGNEDIGQALADAVEQNKEG